MIIPRNKFNELFEVETLQVASPSTCISRISPNRTILCHTATLHPTHNPRTVEIHHILKSEINRVRLRFRLFPRSVILTALTSLPELPIGITAAIHHGRWSRSLQNPWSQHRLTIRILLSPFLSLNWLLASSFSEHGQSHSVEHTWQPEKRKRHWMKGPRFRRLRRIPRKPSSLSIPTSLELLVFAVNWDRDFLKQAEKEGRGKPAPAGH